MEVDEASGMEEIAILEMELCDVIVWVRSCVFVVSKDILLATLRKNMEFIFAYSIIRKRFELENIQTHYWSLLLQSLLRNLCTFMYV